MLEFLIKNPNALEGFLVFAEIKEDIFLRLFRSLLDWLLVFDGLLRHACGVLCGFYKDPTRSLPKSYTLYIRFIYDIHTLYLLIISL